MIVRVVDSHTGGEPTRLVVAGGPDLGGGSMRERLAIFRERFDRYRSAIVNEPRGSDAMVGALLCAPVDPACAAGVIFFNNVGYLGMCGHGTIGLIASLSYLKRIQPGRHRIETPVGTVSAELQETGDVTVANVPSYRYAQAVSVQIPPYGAVRGGMVTGDVAWGGNWFYLVQGAPVAVELANVEELTAYCSRIRAALQQAGITGERGEEIDHIELFDEQGRNFVLCPGKAYDRSPCGTGTSAKLACLYADGKIQPGEVWRQQSMTGSVFTGSIAVHNGQVHPSITGTAFVNAEADLILDERDPFCWGISG